MSTPLAQLQLDEDMLQGCMRCGFCLPACPTYKLRPIESASPRGRIALMKAVQDGKLELAEIAPALDFCVGCQACEVVCPAGVEYGHLLFGTKQELEKIRPAPRLVRFAYDHFLGKPLGIKLAAFGLWLYQRSGLYRVARGLRISERIGGKGLADMEKSLPQAASPWRRWSRPTVTPAVGPRRLRIGFFAGCIQEIAFWETNQNAITVLAAAGCEVAVPPGQGCCGAVHSHSGDLAAAREQARRNIAVFEQGGYDYIVNTAGGCGSELVEYGRTLADDPEWAERAKRFSAACRDVSQVLAELDPLPLGPLAETITYQDSCHLRNVQRVSAPPRQLLKAVPGARFVELPECDQCCGSGGTYSVAQAEASDRLLSRKMQNVVATGATTVVVTNPGCQLEMIEGVQSAGLAGRVKVRHLVDVLAEALKK